ncbi:hypothetical protein AAY473_002109 [Plecturocebus cupreus]
MEEMSQKGKEEEKGQQGRHHVQASLCSLTQLEAVILELEQTLISRHAGPRRLRHTTGKGSAVALLLKLAGGGSQEPIHLLPPSTCHLWIQAVCAEEWLQSGARPPSAPSLAFLSSLVPKASEGAEVGVRVSTAPSTCTLTQAMTAPGPSFNFAPKSEQPPGAGRGQGSGASTSKPAGAAKFPRPPRTQECLGPEWQLHGRCCTQKHGASVPQLELPPHLGLLVASTSTSANQGSSAPIPQQEPGRAETAKAPQAARMPRLCLLQAVGGEFGPTKVHTLFSLSDLRQIKVDLGKFSYDPDNYIDVLQGLGQSFKLDWKDITRLLN